MAAVGRQVEGRKPGASLRQRAKSAGDKVMVVPPAWLRTSHLPAHTTWDKVLGPSGPPFSSVTQETSCCRQLKDLRAVMSGQANITDGQTDSSMLTLEGMCPEPAGEDMPAALPAQAMWKRGLQPCSVACRGPPALPGICLGTCWSRQQWVEGEEDGARSLTVDALCLGIPRTAAMAEQPFGSSSS